MPTEKDSLEKLIATIRAEAEREEFSIDKPIYKKANLNPLDPILFAGDLAAKVGFFARDLGRDEVLAGQPLYGSAGRLVRNGVHLALFGKEAENDERRQKAADQILLTNTVPYKPVGNKAYSQKVKNRFRPFLERFLVCFWKGSFLIPLGTDALKWFKKYDKKLADFQADPDRFTKKIEIKLTANDGADEREITLAPLPHPSPLNQKYYKIFPQMLQERLKQISL